MTSFLDTMIMHNEKAQMKIIENAQVKIKIQQDRNNNRVNSKKYKTTRCRKL